MNYVNNGNFKKDALEITSILTCSCHNFSILFEIRLSHLKNIPLIRKKVAMHWLCFKFQAMCTSTHIKLQKGIQLYSICYTELNKCQARHKAQAHLVLCFLSDMIIQQRNIKEAESRNASCPGQISFAGICIQLTTARYVS